MADRISTRVDPAALTAVFYLGAVINAFHPPGIRLSPHFYNTHADIDRTVAAIKKYMTTGV